MGGVEGGGGAKVEPKGRGKGAETGRSGMGWRQGSERPHRRGGADQEEEGQTVGEGQVAKGRCPELERDGTKETKKGRGRSVEWAGTKGGGVGAEEGGGVEGTEGEGIKKKKKA